MPDYDNYILSEAEDIGLSWKIVGHLVNTEQGYHEIDIEFEDGMTGKVDVYFDQLVDWMNQKPTHEWTTLLKTIEEYLIETDAEFEVFPKDESEGFFEMDENE